MSQHHLSVADVYQARANIAQRIINTPLRHSQSLSSDSQQVYLKLESQQITGSFKLRGATNAVQSLLKRAAQSNTDISGVVGVSTGNHGKGLAYAAKQAGVPCVICMSSLVPKNKVDGIANFGAQVRIIGRSQDEAQHEVDRLVDEQNMVMLPPFDHADIIAGQATIGLELIEQLPTLDNVIVPVSGGGLISGIALTLKALKPSIRIIGVSMERGCAMYTSQHAGKPVLVEELPTLADSLGGGIGLDNHYTFSIVKDCVDELILVNETQIADAISHAYWQEQQVIEGSGAVGIACLMHNVTQLHGNTAVIVSGCNIDMQMHAQIIQGHYPDL